MILHRLLHPVACREWPGNTRVFIGTGMGRSGTRFLSSLLDRAPEARVVHEPVDDDVPALRHGYCSPRRRLRYVKNFRIPEIHLRLGDDPPAVYGEVNSCLRRHVGAFRRLCPSVRIFHLVRDGREVVRSMYARRTMAAGDRATHGLRPCGGDPFHERWDELSRFERLCWYWASGNAFVRTRADWTVRLEDVLGDYERFRGALLEPLGLDLVRAEWARDVGSPRNVTESHALPAPEDWDPGLQERFWKICGDEMRRYGYA